MSGRRATPWRRMDLWLSLAGCVLVIASVRLPLVTSTWETGGASWSSQESFFDDASGDAAIAVGLAVVSVLALLCGRGVIQRLCVWALCGIVAYATVEEWLIDFMFAQRMPSTEIHARPYLVERSLAPGAFVLVLAALVLAAASVAGWWRERRRRSVAVAS